eukprot:5571281-Pyramimonas_sp.AAC.2
MASSVGTFPFPNPEGGPDLQLRVRRDLPPLFQKVVLPPREYATACLQDLRGGQSGVHGTRRCSVCDEGGSPVGFATECSSALSAQFDVLHASDSALSFSPPAGGAGGVYLPARLLSAVGTRARSSPLFRLALLGHVHASFGPSSCSHSIRSCVYRRRTDL